MGQGLNTKVAQVVAYELGTVLGDGQSVDMSLIGFNDTNSVSPSAQDRRWPLTFVDTFA